VLTARHREHWTLASGNAPGLAQPGLGALAREPGFDVERELDRLKRVPTGCSGRTTAIPADLYSQPP